MKSVLSLLLLIVCGGSQAQNLAPNGSFEQHGDCYPNWTGNIVIAIPWFDSYEGYKWGSSDYHNYCFGISSWLYPHYQKPRNNGHGMAGAALFSPNSWGINVREDIEVSLLSPLLPDVEYCVSFYITLHPRRNWDDALTAIDAIEAYFCNDTLIRPIIDPPFNLIPQISNFNGSIIKDTINWVNISGSFIAQGGERFMTIGCFKPDSVLHFEFLGSVNYGTAYYFFDDVAVWQCDAPVFKADCGEDKCIQSGQSVTIGAHNLPEYQYYWFDKDSIVIDSTAYLTVSPDTTTSYYLWVLDFKYDVSWDTVTVFVDEICDTAVDLFSLYIPNIFSPNGDGQNDVLYARGENINEIQFSVYNRWGELVFETKNIATGWDGKLNDKECNPGVYMYHVRAVYKDGREQSKKGNVTLVR